MWNIFIKHRHIWGQKTEQDPVYPQFNLLERPEGHVGDKKDLQTVWLKTWLLITDVGSKSEEGLVAEIKLERNNVKMQIQQYPNMRYFQWYV